MSMTPLASKKLARIVLLRREKTIRVRPSNSSKGIAGGGLSGVIRTTLDSTWGGGRKEFRDTFMMWSTFE